MFSLQFVGKDQVVLYNDKTSKHIIHVIHIKDRADEKEALST